MSSRSGNRLTIPCRYAALGAAIAAFGACNAITGIDDLVVADGPRGGGGSGSGAGSTSTGWTGAGAGGAGSTSTSTSSTSTSTSTSTSSSGACDPVSQPSPAYGSKNGACLPGCATLGGTCQASATCPTSWAPAPGGPAYDCTTCCTYQSPCDTVSQPFPAYGEKNGVCLPSCKMAGGETCGPGPSCPAGSFAVPRGPTYDCGACCYPSSPPIQGACVPPPPGAAWVWTDCTVRVLGDHQYLDLPLPPQLVGFLQFDMKGINWSPGFGDPFMFFPAMLESDTPIGWINWHLLFMYVGGNGDDRLISQAFTSSGGWLGEHMAKQDAGWDPSIIYTFQVTWGNKNVWADAFAYGALVRSWHVVTDHDFTNKRTFQVGNGVPSAGYDTHASITLSRVLVAGINP